MRARKNIYTKKQQRKIKLIHVIISLSSLLLIVIILASFFDKSPVRMLVEAWNQLISKEKVGWATLSQLKSEIKDKDSLIFDLQSQLGLIQEVQGSKKGVVQISSEHLNMRDEPKLDGKVIEQIPVGSLVDIMYYHGDTDRLGEEFGRWCKIEFNGKQGWVWGNYISVVD